MADLRTWGDYEVDLDRVLGKGGMGIVYRGRQVSVDRPVAIKVLQDEIAGSMDFRERFKREAKLVASLIDSHVVQVFGAGEAEGRHFYVMEFVEGQDLATAMQAGRRFSPDEVLRIAVQAGQALQAAWRLKIVHRDIKPSNFILTKDEVLKVTDFGLAKRTDLDLTHSGIISGTANYISPEQASGGNVDIRSDLYSLGCTLYELAVGRPPFHADSATALLYQHVHQVPPSPRAVNPAVPLALEELILRCLHKRPEDRYPSPEAFVADAQRIVTGGDAIREMPTRDLALKPVQGSKRRWKVAAGLALLVGGGFAARGSWKSKPSTPPVAVPPAPVAERPPAVAAPQVPVAVENPTPEKPQPERIAQALRRYEEVRDQGEDAIGRDDLKQAKISFAQAFRLASEPAQKMEAEALIRLCDRCCEADEAFRAQDWALAETLYQGLPEAPPVLRSRAEARLESVRAKRTLQKTAEAQRATEESDRKISLEESLPIARVLFERAWSAQASGVEEVSRSWEKAREAFETASAKGPLPAEDLSRLNHARAAAQAPPGMRYVPAGRFRLGLGGADQVTGPEQDLSLPAFYISQREVTRAEYKAFLDASGDHSRCHKDEPKEKKGRDGHLPDRWDPVQDPEAPVTGLDWFDAYAYAAWKGLRLPTEAEWEKAAGTDPRTGARSTYPWGDEFRENQEGPSRSGCRGMGNEVLEWVENWYEAYAGGAARASEFGRTRRVVRGGSPLLDDARERVRVTTRFRASPEKRDPRIGLRVAMTAE